MDLDSGNICKSQSQNLGFKGSNVDDVLDVEQWSKSSPLQDFWRDHGSSSIQFTCGL